MPSSTVARFNPRRLCNPLMICGAILMAMISGVKACGSVSPERALQDATTLVQRFSNWNLYRGEGTSMAPRFDDSHLILVATVDSGSLKPGMIALFRDTEGDLVAHTVESVQDGYVYTRGLNNGKLDPVAISPDAVIGVVVGTLAANAPIPDSFGLPVALGKTY